MFWQEKEYVFIFNPQSARNETLNFANSVDLDDTALICRLPDINWADFVY